MEHTQEILQELSRLYPDARPALHFRTPYELLVAVILSAQCTDERVNLVTEQLFRVADTPERMVALSVEQLERYIYSCGFYHSKAKHILAASQALIEQFGGQVPATQEQLQQLAGVGRKTANVVYAVAFGGDAIAVDTHVFRVSNRLGLAAGKTPEEVERALMQGIPKSLWSSAHHWLIYHGRRVCHARRPDCAACTLRQYCRAHQEGGRE